jgi:hypothetical protein
MSRIASLGPGTAGLPQPDAGPAAVFVDELDARTREHVSYQFERSRVGFAQRPLFPLGAMDLRELPLLFLPDHSGGFTRR